MYVCMYVCVWMDGWMDGWMDVRTHVCICSFHIKANIVILTCTSDIAQTPTTPTLIPNIFTLNLG